MLVVVTWENLIEERITIQALKDAWIKNFFVTFNFILECS